MAVKRICPRHGVYTARRCPACETARNARPRPQTTARQIRSTSRWKAVTRAVRARDDHRCTFGMPEHALPELAGVEARESGHYPDRRCPVVEGLDVHHRIPIEAGGQPYAQGNLRTLCRTHHARLQRRRHDEDDMRG